MFLKLNHINGNEILINVNNIVSVQRNPNKKSETIITYQSAGGDRLRYDFISDDYEKVKDYLCETGNIFNR